MHEYDPNVIVSLCQSLPLAHLSFERQLRAAVARRWSLLARPTPLGRCCTADSCLSGSDGIIPNQMAISLRKMGFQRQIWEHTFKRNQLSSELVATLISWRHTLRPRICWQNLGSERMISGRTTRKARVKFGRSSLMVKVHHWCNYVTVCHYVNEWFMPLSILNHNRTTTVQFSSNLAKYNQLSSKIIKDLQISSTSVKDHQKPSSSVIYHEISWNIINDNQISSIRININDHQISSLIMKYHHMSSIIINYKSDFWNPPASHVWHVSMVLLSLCFELKI